MSEGNGKAVGGAAVGVGGMAAMIMKLCSHEPGLASTAARGAGEIGIVARGAGEVGALGAAGRGAGAAGEIGALKAAGAGAGEIGALKAAGHGAGEVGALKGAGAGAGELGALGHGAGAFVSGERGAGQLVLTGVGTPVEVSKLSPVAVHAAEDGARVGAKGATAVRAPAVPAIPAASKAARSSKLKTALEHAVDAKDALDLVLEGWDIYKDSLDDDVETELNRKLSPNGLSSSDVLPAVKGEPVDGLAGATRLMLSDGHALVPAARLPENAKSSRLGLTDKHAISQHEGTPVATIYLEVPSDDRVTKATSLETRLFMADISPKIEWVELATAGPIKLPAILEQGSHRFVRIATGGTRVVILRAIPSAAK